MLSNMKIIQMSGLGIPIFDMIFKFRDAELDSAKSYRGLLVWVMGLGEHELHPGQIHRVLI